MTSGGGTCERPDDFPLSIAADVALAAQFRQQVFMTEILRPGFVFLRRPAFLAAEQCQCLPEGVRIEVRQARRRKRLLEDGPDRTGAAPVLAVQSYRRKTEIFADRDLCR